MHFNFRFQLRRKQLTNNWIKVNKLLPKAKNGLKPTPKNNSNTNNNNIININTFFEAIDLFFVSRINASSVAWL